MPKSLSDYAEMFERIAETLIADKKQATKPKHLYIAMRRDVVQASRLLMELIESTPVLPFSPPRCGYNMLRDKDEDDELFFAWRFYILTWLIKGHKDAFKADAGIYEWPPQQTDSSGNPVWRENPDAVPASEDELQVISKWFPNKKIEGDIYCSRKAREDSRVVVVSKFLPVSVTESEDEVDVIARLRFRTQDFADSCRAIAQLLREADSVGHRDKGTDASKRRREERNIEVREHLLKNPEATCREIGPVRGRTNSHERASQKNDGSLLA